MGCGLWVWKRRRSKRAEHSSDDNKTWANGDSPPKVKSARSVYSPRTDAFCEVIYLPRAEKYNLTRLITAVCSVADIKISLIIRITKYALFRQINEGNVSFK